VSGEILTAGLVAAGQGHSPPAGAHLILLAGVAVAALAIFGAKWWRGRRDSAVADKHSNAHEHAAENTRSTEAE